MTKQELLVDFITSLDGYAAAKGWPGFWGLEGPEYLAWLGQQPRTRLYDLDGSEHVPSDVRIRLSIWDIGIGSEKRRRVQRDRAYQRIQGGILLDAAAPAALGKYPADRRGCGRSV